MAIYLDSDTREEDDDGMGTVRGALIAVPIGLLMWIILVLAMAL
jgi:hypothetical protein